MTNSLLYDSHMHTPLCKHAKGMPTEYAEVAQKRGLKGIIITCHNPGPEGWSERVRMSLDDFDNYIDMVEQARISWKGIVDVRLGLESDFFPGIEPLLERLHSKADFHFILGSVHPQLPYYKNEYFADDIRSFERGYFEHLAMAAESGLYDCLSHPDLIKNMFPDQWNPDNLIDDIRRSLDRIAKTGVCMELNTSGLHKRYKEMNPGRLMLTEMCSRQIPVVLGSDSHAPSRVSANFEEALETLKAVGYTQVTHFLKRQPHQVGIDAALGSLQNGRHVL